ncbi:uncharacterized protein N7479_010261 [Penicillium vulpinum]|uniref:(S)-ureidoglycine aminohydrolase cupin domain-containing protein n=1 Tax=Penicillium vulpinum TaxID=29845 RepID=A0A1V6RFK5_9EURO|nr:uncharacterized protein N7479_010261 [Penicillium vulpinum]KAJ5951848.1 hypothetical protein N7479_010261 [Penicillium vulpinum]OQE00572.1 hypothetical protein PENVUL_c049G06486 [Penicillium vulpinum]
MVFEHLSEGKFFKIPKIPFNDHVLYDDVYTSKEGTSPENSLTGSFFFIEKTDVPEGKLPAYIADETGIVVRGTVNLEDETGKKVTLKAGDTFFIHRGSQVAWSSDDYAVCFKAGNRAKFDMNEDPHKN